MQLKKIKLVEYVKKIFAKHDEKPLSFYHLLGKEEGIGALVENFYEIMQQDPKASDCLKVHPLVDGKIPENSKEKLTSFLIGWTGGPPLFQLKYGPPRMRMRHARFKIGTKEKEQWLFCMQKALSKQKGIKKKDQDRFLRSCMAIATRVQNQP